MLCCVVVVDEIFPASGSVKVNICIACAYATWVPLHIPGNLMNKRRVGRQPEYDMVFRCLLRGLEIMERFSMMFTANGKMKFPF